jgi:hypothetical protein
MDTVRNALGIAIALLAAGCFGGRSAASAPCVEGQSAPCTCEDGRAGASTCQSNGVLGACDCSTSGSSTGGGGVAAGGDEPNPDVSVPTAGGSGGTGSGGMAAGGTGSGGDGAAGSAGLDSGAPPIPDAGSPDADARDATVDAGGGMTVPGAFVPCSNSNQCEGDLVCASINVSSGGGSGGSGGSSGGGGNSGGYCTQRCMTTSDCTAVPPTGNATAKCMVGQCILTCGEGVVCPDGMSCLVIPFLPGSNFCHY